MSNSLREWRDQFAPGSTADGNRLERLLRDVMARFNRLQPRDVRRRWVLNRYVWGGQQSQPYQSVQQQLPWMPIHNDLSAARLVTGTSHPIDGVSNPFRVKGTAVPDIDPTGLLGTGQQWCVSNALAFTRPTILTGISLVMATDTDFQNSFQYTAPTPPPSRTAGDPVDDFTLTLEIDDPFNPTTRSLTAVEFQRARLRADAWPLTPIVPAPGWANFAPVFPGGVPGGVLLWADQLNIPLPRSSKARLSLVIPEYVGYTCGWAANSGKPWQNQRLTMTLDVLEEVMDE